MFHQTGAQPFPALDTPCRRLLVDVTGVRRDSRAGAPGLPSFLSAAPPRSEGEALLRRIFSREAREA